MDNFPLLENQGPQTPQDIDFEYQIGELEGFLDGPVIPYREAEQSNDYVDARKRPKRKRAVEDDSWMPEGWVKKVNQRPPTGKFPGYEDKTYYAPGVKRAFRSRKEALKYIEELESSSKGTVAEPGSSSKGPA